MLHSFPRHFDSHMHMFYLRLLVVSFTHKLYKEWTV